MAQTGDLSEFAHAQSGADGLTWQLPGLMMKPHKHVPRNEQVALIRLKQAIYDKFVLLKGLVNQTLNTETSHTQKEGSERMFLHEGSSVGAVVHSQAMCLSWSTVGRTGGSQFCRKKMISSVSA